MEETEVALDPRPEALSEPLAFPPAVMLSCLRINNRVYDPHTNRVAPVKDILIIMDESDGESKDKKKFYAHEYADKDISSTFTASSKDTSSRKPLPKARGTDYAEKAMNDYGNADNSSCTAERAYWLQNSLVKCIYGNIRKGVELRRRERTAEINAEWELTYPRVNVAVKEMNWGKIRRFRQNREAEDPIKEVEAMQFISRLPETPEKSYILQQKDLLFDDRFLYLILPYCNQGDLFGLLEKYQLFNESQSRFLMRQMFLGLKYMQEIAGICHRDISLENVLVNEDENGLKSIIMDFGMCLRVPHLHGHDGVLRRLRMPPQGTCGKFFYMSPEIFSNSSPFDGFKCDMWALGIMLFMMLTSSNPFDAPRESDKYFQCITGGYLRRMFLNGGYQFTEEVMDLMQRLLTKDFTDRLSLQQALNHPWLQYGEELAVPSPPQHQAWR